MSKSKPRTTTLDKGNAFEQQVIDVLRLLPNAVVQEHVSIGGKNIDAVCDITDSIGANSTVAFECKDYERPLTREYVASVLADYQPLLNQSLIDRFCLVTRNGVVANAKKCFDDKVTQHLTYSELLDRLIAPRPLISNMYKQFGLDDLDKYYVPTSCYDVDLLFISQNFPLIYNSFIDFAIEGVYDYATANYYWKKYAPDEESASLSDQYNSTSFNKARNIRKSQKISALEPIIIKWVNNTSIPQALALLGSYGTGKSSFAKRIAHVWADRYEKGLTNRIPLLIELRDFGSHQDIRGLITHELVNRHGLRLGSYEYFSLMNRQGKFLLILDGFDEMKQGLSKDVLLFNFNELNKLYTPQSKIILCGRPTVFASEGEQTAILSGSSETDFTHSVEYIQINITSFSHEDIFEFLDKYSSVKYPNDKSHVSGLIKEIKKELPSNADLEVLLSRPVHLPMLIAILPQWRLRIKDLSRAKLYELFIDKVIAREMLKRKQEFKEHYDIAARRRFASDLAVQMFKLGDSRSIRFSEIPDEIVRPYKFQKQTLDSAKRDLINACFLERKPPDILFFGHKSFAEFLVAEKVLEVMSEEPPNTNSLGIKFSPEVVSFIAEMATVNNWITLTKVPLENTRLLDSSLKFLLRKSYIELPTDISRLDAALGSSEVFNKWQMVVSRLPVMLTFRFVEYIQAVISSTKHCSLDCEKFLRFLIEHSEDMVSVHAFRALELVNRISIADVTQLIGKKRVDQWGKYKWINESA
ncbi:MAG TPA: NACHT domain-containing protein [Pyrinomonadaceae bacterium]|nr:NACHT domain-containing protein [Pyrinomonadaceae bacterium]